MDNRFGDILDQLNCVFFLILILHETEIRICV